MDHLERAYRQQIGAWTGQQRVARSISLLNEVRSMLRRKVQALYPGLDERGIQIEVAKCLYRTDQETLRLLEKLER